MNLWIIFLTGLTVGGLTCLAVQGGLLASVIASREEGSLGKGTARHAIYSTIVFLIFKLISHTALGFALGAFGGVINIDGKVQIYMQLAAGIYMVIVALNLLNIHPIFRYAIIQPPRFLTRLVRNQSKSKDIFAPAILGAMTIFIPCGTTVAIETLAISSANALSGAAIMASFVIGTIPLFFGIGAITSLAGEAFKSKFLKIAAVGIIYLGLMSINASLVAMRSPITLQSITENIPSFNKSEEKPVSGSTVQNAEIQITTSGYKPDYIRVKKGEPVEIKLINKDAYSCAAAFRIPSLRISKNVKPNDEQIITFTPDKTGKIQFNCSMGMYRGIVEVI